MISSSSTVTELPSAPGEAGGLGVYIHIPFCIVRCAYCDFNAYSGMDDLMPAYVDALLAEIETHRRRDSQDLPLEIAVSRACVATVFFGGGTPTQLGAADLGRILRRIGDVFEVDEDAEITIECNPESVDERKFAQLLEAGFNRVSIGVQSISPHVLERLGRVHSAARALQALAQARSAGFERVNADLIFGTPGESDAEFKKAIDEVVSRGVDHVSAYALTVEDNTPLASKIARGLEEAPDEDLQAHRAELAADKLAKAGFIRYEVSNWATKGSWCRHNLGYWRSGDYFGFGAGAHSHRSGRRWWNLRSPRTYIDKSPSLIEGEEHLGTRERVDEAMMLAMRLAGGVNRSRFMSRWGVDPVARWGAELDLLSSQGLVTLEPESIRPTQKGLMFASLIGRTLIRSPAGP